MKPKLFSPKKIAVSVILITTFVAFGAAGQSCALCHTDKYTQWFHSVHANTQVDVAGELSQSHPGESPDDVIQGENCIACHAPTAVLENGGMSEGQALGFFFTTSNQQFTASTTTTNAAFWPHVDCTACHNPHDPLKPSYFNSTTRKYESMTNSAQLCGQCHGNLRFADTDHQIYNGWMTSKHANTQVDVAGELSQSHPGESPDDVIQGENCIACHAPTAVLENGGMSEGQALGHFFTTSNGLFTDTTMATNSAAWPHVDCAACHNPHDAGKPSYFNSATGQYQSMTNSDQLCGQCHGNQRFPDTDHLSYNIEAGTGGIGVADQQTMPGVRCVDCHMYASDVDGSNSKKLRGHTWAITVPEDGDASGNSCQACHSGATDSLVKFFVTGIQGQFQTVDATAQASVARAAAVMQNVQDPMLVATFQEAQHNLGYAESNESGGFHNHLYLLALLYDANSKALSLPILDVAVQDSNIVISWTGAGILQAADSLSGPWHDVPDATNPLIISPAARAPQQFYRLRP